MNPYKLREVYKQLTSQNSLLKKYLKLGTKDIKQPDLPAFVETKNAVNAFMRRNPRPDQIDRKDMAGGGMLVQPSADGSRPGYAKAKKATGAAASAYKRDFKKNPPWNKGLSDPSKFTYTSSGKKIYKSTKDAIQKMESTTVPFYSERKKMWGVRRSKKDGKKQSVVYKKKKSDIDKFIKKQSEKALAKQEEARTTGQAKRIANEKKYVKDIENWVDNWFKNNKFTDVRDIDKAINKFKKDYAKAKINKPEGVVRSAAVEGFPNIPEAGKQALTRSKIKGGFQNSYYRKRFLNNVLDNNPLLEERVNNYFDYVLKDKSTLKAIQEGGYENLQQLKNAYEDTFKNMDDIAFLLSQDDTGLYGAGKYDFLNKRFENYDAYAKKVNTSGVTYLNNIKKIENTIGPQQLKKLLNGETSIIKFMAKQQSDLAQIFDVKQLPLELRFSLDHNIGVADISRMNKSQMIDYINSYIGTTVKRNTELGLGGFANRRTKLIKNINNGIDVKKNLAKLNKITQIAYPETLGKNAYKIVGGKVDVTRSFIFPKTQKELFTEYFKELDKTKKGSAAIKKQAGSLDNLLAKIGCPGLASGGRAGFVEGADCPTKGANLINSGMKNATPAQLKNFAVFANRARALGRNIRRFGIIPEAMYVAADSAIRLTMGDKPIEALLRASEYLLPGDQTKLAEVMEAKRLSSPETAAIIGRSIDYKNQLAKIQSLEDTRANLENLSGGGEFDYIGDLNNDVRNLDNQIKQATDALNTKFKMTDAEQTYADAMQAEVDDIRKSKSLLTKIKSMFRDTGQEASDVETLGAPEVTQEQLNKRMADLLPRDLLLASEAEMLQAAKVAQAQGFKIPDDYYIQQQRDVKNMSLAELAAATSPEQVYGAQGYIAEPLNKGVVEKPQNVIGDMEREITGQTNVVNPFDLDLSMMGSGLRGFSAAGGGIAKQAGVDSGPPPDSGPTPQGLSYLMKRGKNI